MRIIFFLTAPKVGGGSKIVFETMKDENEEAANLLCSPPSKTL